MAPLLTRKSDRRGEQRRYFTATLATLAGQSRFIDKRNKIPNGAGGRGEEEDLV